RAALGREIGTGDAHLVEIGVARERPQRGVVVLPSEAPDAGGAELGHRLDHAANAERLPGRHGAEGDVRHRLYETESKKRRRLTLGDAVGAVTEGGTRRVTDLQGVPKRGPLHFFPLAA